MKKFLIIIISFIFLILVSLISFPTLALRYPINSNLSNVEASFIGEKSGDGLGVMVASAGDVNGDGFDDILIGARLNDEKGLRAGQIYLIFGKETGWRMDTNISNVNASYYSDYHFLNKGFSSLAACGDVNGDGYDDFLISYEESEWERGLTYLIFGKASGWKMDTNLTEADVSFWGEFPGDRSGWSIDGAGDVNGDGYDDILIGAPLNEQVNQGAGQTYLIFGKPNGWKKKIILSSADASFLGDGENDGLGFIVGGARDINNDGYDDILIYASGKIKDQFQRGMIYLIFGKASGWNMDTDLSISAASFIRERGKTWNEKVDSITGAGDVNGDGYDDILIGDGDYNQEGFQRGKTYLIFGKSTNWTNNLDLSKADVSFLGENAWDGSGGSVAGVGDVNGDKYDDILIGASTYGGEGLGPGKSYLILGKASGWSVNINLSKADSSFIGEGYDDDRSGISVSGAGDVNGDGYDDILIGAFGNDEGNPGAGQTYLIFPEINSEPNPIISLIAYSKPDYSEEVKNAFIKDTIFVELIGIDGSPTNSDIALVNVTSNQTSPLGFILRLYETSPNSGTYRGIFNIEHRIKIREQWIGASDGEKINISSIDNPTIFTSFLVREPIQLKSDKDMIFAQEDHYYNQHYWTENGTPIGWNFNTNATWLLWNYTNNNLSGMPDNNDVGSYWVHVQVTDGQRSDEHFFNLIVKNTPPNILSGNILETFEDQEYVVDYSSDDDGQGSITWHLETNATWLTINNKDGKLSGTPLNNDVGYWSVKVFVDDGNGGWAWSNFTLKVINVNDPPEFISTPKYKSTTDSEYLYNVRAFDIDKGDILHFSLEKKPKGMQINVTSGIISWKSVHGQEGLHEVIVLVTDSNATTNQSFTIKVTTETWIGNEWGMCLIILVIIIMIMLLIFKGMLTMKKRTLEDPTIDESNKRLGTSEE